MSARELAEWQAFDDIDPIGDERIDLLVGILASVMANPHRKRGARAFKPSDFMPFIDREALSKAEQKKANTALRTYLMGLGNRRS